ncbi:Ca2+/H+ antiporter [Wickerhamomyces ciferrii]|uniref:Ca2+/H+ antiporter n=1 Tax=Wickerhamomyces ciferrii (strain ATCC 14091 / BCRC 22168 / CBS 111 / JCM 3599 / NBRC 0793 / NRRL Y-1031 F-60-10) TaxID=1206466 RepID=K0KEA7_WICCF|nr:Ca2+/H+ antiporter [Wickerhamomyces ciferrii]CCH43455.1 Ca2+/H+ antiporter [Wickerhamomyces ciferrii]
MSKDKERDTGSPQQNIHKNQYNQLGRNSAQLSPQVSNTTASGGNVGQFPAQPLIQGQYDNRSQASSQNNTLKANQNPNKKKKRPQLQKNPSLSFQQVPSPKYVYSVDDDLDEIEQDIEREYLEGYNDALRHRYRKSTKNLKEQPKEVQNLVHDVTSNLINADSTLKKLEQKQADYHIQGQLPSDQQQQGEEDRQSNHTFEDAERGSHHYQQHLHPFNQQSRQPSLSRTVSQLSHNQTQSQQKLYYRKQDDQTRQDNDQDNEDQDQDYGQDDVDDYHDGNNDNNNDDNDDNHSTTSEEDFTLRNRQDAINVTHPFGIRIWKPALYKKDRSVQREADQDIHETDDDKQKKISYGIHLANLLWSISFGLLFFILCTIGSIFLLIFGYSSVNYAKVFFNLGIYFLWPFGKVIYLQKDENYLNEDINEGSTFIEYERWRTEEQNKLFFSASQINLPTTDTHVTGTSSAIQQPPSQHQQQQQQQPSQLNPQQQKNLLPLPSIEETVDDDNDNKKKRLFGRGDWSLGRILFYLYFYLILQPIFLIVWLLCWLLVFTIPMAKIISNLTDHLRRHPLAIFFKFDSSKPLPSDKRKNSNILVCTYRAAGFHYYKYTVEGTNIFFINLMFIVIFTIVDFFIIKDFFGVEKFFTNESVIFALCLLSIIPLAYFIGQAVASISAQSSMGVGAVINAFFSTIVEIFLYCVALNQHKGSLVEGSMIGSILGAVLLLPGLSMCAGAFIRKTQRYNPASAGVSSTMLLFSISVMFAPTIFHQIYGSYEISCVPCLPGMLGANYNNGGQKTCQKCHFFQPPLKVDYLFKEVLRPFSIICALLLFLAYTIGLWFTLRTHAALIWQTPITENKQQQQQQKAINPSPSNENINEVQQSQVIESGGHDAPNWSRQKSTIVLLGATLLYAIIAEILVDCVDSVLKNFPINPKFLGITIFALVPNTTEFLNAISFATHGNVALSMEIGSAYALQVCLIQIPSLVLYSIFFIGDKESLVNVKDSMFTLIFPKWDLVASIISVVLFTYIYAKGKSNYFKGSILILIYIIVIIGFYFTGKIDSSDLFFASSFIMT